MSTTTIDNRSTPSPPRAMGAHEKEILSSIYLHRMLTTGQIHRLHDPTKHVRATQLRLGRLRDRGYLTHAVGPMPGKEYRWYLTERGAEMAELGGDVEIRSFRMSHDSATGTHADHLIALNDIGIALTDAARANGDSFDYRRWRHEIAHRYGRASKDVLSADAVITYDVRTNNGVTAERRFLEVDRDTESVHDLAEKVYAYQLFSKWEPTRKDSEAHLPKLGWRRSYHVYPGVVFVYAGLSPERARARTEDLANFLSLENRLVAGSTQVDVAVTTLEAIRSHGPFAAICRLLPTQETVPMFRRR